MPPPNCELLSSMRLRVMVTSPAENRIAPPVPPVSLPQRPEASIERFALATNTAPPRASAKLSLRMQPRTTTGSPLDQMAPPSSAWPCASVSPENVAVAGFPPACCTLKSRVAPAPSMMMRPAPGPAISSVSLMRISLARLIVPVRPAWNWMMSPPLAAFACSTAARRLPAPASLRLVTVMVAAPACGEAATAAPSSVWTSFMVDSR